MRCLRIHISRPLRTYLAIPLLLALAALPLSAATGVLHLLVRDVDTHYAVQAKIHFDGPESQSAETDATGSLAVSLPEGQYRIEISAPGYQTMRTRASVQPARTWTFGIMLDPVAPPEEEQSLQSSLRPGFTLLHGYATDDQGHPVQGVRVRLLHEGGETMTNERGYYELSVPTPPETEPDTPGTDTLIAQKKGYETIIHRNIIVAGEDGGGMFFDMEKGTSVVEFDDTHKLMKGGTSEVQSAPLIGARPVNAPSPELYNWLGTAGTALRAGAAEATVSPLRVTVPSSIVVGLSCTDPTRLSTCTTCGTTTSWSSCNTWKSYPLETYVQIGLGQEWYPTWAPDSLKAGAVAYRSYGGYFVQSGNQYTTNFDICSSTACQAFNPNYSPPTAVKNAQSATAGVVLSSDGVNIFFAEYAAESNLASDTTYATCPDGQVGEPAHNWPCMSDPIDIGKSQSSTHSRGMCQRGSQRWASGKDSTGAPGDTGATLTTPRDWRCILDHYYNASSNSITVDPSGTGSPGAGSGLRTAFMQGQPTYGNIAYQDASTSPASIRIASAADGSGDQLLVTAGVAPSWSPGGSQLAYESYVTNYGLSVINADGSGNTPITSNSGVDQYGNQKYDFNPTWSQLGDKIAFCSTRSGSGVDVWTVNPDGTGLTQVSHGLFNYNMGTGPEGCYLSWSPDGTKIAYTGDTVTGPYPNYVYNIYTMLLDGSGVTQQTQCSNPGWQAVCENPNWSPDGTKIAFDDIDFPSDNIGGPGIYTLNFSSTGTTLTPIALNTQYIFQRPHWDTSGQRIMFLSNQSGNWGIWSINSDGTSPTQIIGGGKHYTYNPQAIDCSHCGRFNPL